MPSMYTNAAMRGFGKYGSIPESKHKWFVSAPTFKRGSKAAKRKMMLVRSFKHSLRKEVAKAYKKNRADKRGDYNPSFLFQ